MKLRLLISTIALVFGLSVIAQAQEEINRAEFFGGFSHNRVDIGTDEISERQGLNGVNASITGNFSKYAGIKFDFATHSKTFSDNFDGDPYNVKLRNTSFMGGVQFKNNLKDGPRVKPFAHILAGIARQKVNVNGTGVDVDVLKDSSFTMAVGGGIDVKVHKRVDIRIIQFDYNPVFRSETVDFDGTPVTFDRQNNFRIGFGIVIH